MNVTTYGLDVAKRVFLMYSVDAQTGEVANRPFGRDDLITFLAQRPAGRVALKACGSAHWWARKIQALGHEVVLLHAQFIRPFVQTNKTDAADAKAIWTAVQQPGMRTVAPCEFPAYRRHFVFGVMAPPDFRRNGATAFPA
jgi:transposase